MSTTITIANLQMNRAVFPDDQIEALIPQEGISVIELLGLAMAPDLRMRILIYSLPRNTIRTWLAGVVERLASRKHQPTHLLGSFAELLDDPKDTRFFGRAVRRITHAAVEAAGNDVSADAEARLAGGPVAPNDPKFIEIGKAAEAARETERSQQMLDLCRLAAEKEES